MQNPTWYNNQVHGCRNITVQSYYFIIPWQHVVSCVNMAVDLSWWFQQHCSSLFVHRAMNSLFQHAWTSLSTTMFKLASSTMFNPVNRQKQTVRFYVCMCPLEYMKAHVFKCIAPWTYRLSLAIVSYHRIIHRIIVSYRSIRGAEILFG